MRSLSWPYIVIVGAAACMSPRPGSGDETPPPAPLVLRLEYIPTPRLRKGMMPTAVLPRELGRQAALIAAREELGLPTRDQTLGESMTSYGLAGRPLLVHARMPLNGPYAVWLTERTGPKPREKWRVRYPLDRAPARLYLGLTRELEAASRGPMVDAIQAALDATKPNKEAAEYQKAIEPDELKSIERLLDRLDVVAQWAAVRKAHGAMREAGQTPEMLSAIARGYAHLSLLTAHHWSPAAEAFAARAMLYAERSVAAHPDAALAKWTQVYVRSMGGLHAAALAQLKELRSAEAAGDLPSWTQLPMPVCHYNLKRLDALARSHEPCAAWAEFMHFRALRNASDSYVMFRAITDQKQRGALGDAMGLYAELALNIPYHRGGLRQWALKMGPPRFAGMLVRSVHECDELPAGLRELIPVGAEKGEWWNRLLGDPDTTDALTVVPRTMAMELRREAAARRDLEEPSWEMLAAIIEEENFVQAINQLQWSSGQFGRSDISNVTALVKNHRYARLAQGYGISTNDSSAQSAFFRDFRLGDPQPQMRWVFSRYFRFQSPEYGEYFGGSAMNGALELHEITADGLGDAVKYAIAWRWEREERQRRILGELLAKVSPYSPRTIWVQLATTPEPTEKQLRAWAARTGEFPSLLVKLGQAYHKLGKIEEALKPLTRAVELDPSEESCNALAAAQLAAGDEAGWLKTMTMLAGHTRAEIVERRIAEHYLDVQNWDAAEPYARRAAKGSPAGYAVMRAWHEGQGQWDESEEWARRQSLDGGGPHRLEWYLWCRRTGRGNLPEARRLARSFVEDVIASKTLYNHEHVATFYLLEGKVNEALPALDDAYHQTVRPYYAILFLLAADAHGRQPAVTRGIEEIRGQRGRWDARDREVANLVLKSILDPEKTVDEAKWRELIEKAEPETRCQLRHYEACLLDRAGKTKEAEALWRLNVTEGPLRTFTSALSGRELAKRFGTSR